MGLDSRKITSLPEIKEVIYMAWDSFPYNTQWLPLGFLAISILNIQIFFFFVHPYGKPIN